MHYIISVGYQRANTQSTEEKNFYRETRFFFKHDFGTCTKNTKFACFLSLLCPEQLDYACLTCSRLFVVVERLRSLGYVFLLKKKRGWAIPLSSAASRQWIKRKIIILVRDSLESTNSTGSSSMDSLMMLVHDQLMSC